MKPSSRQVGITIVVLAAAVRLAFVAESASSAVFTHPLPSLDVDLTWRGAEALRKGISPSFELMALSAPFYVYWTAFWQMILGESLLVHRILAALMGALMPWFVFRAAYRDEGKLWPAALVACLVCLLPSVVLMDTRLMKTSLEMAMVAWLILLVPRGRAGTSGVLLGTLFLSQIMTIFLWLPVLVYWNDRKRIARACAGIGAGLVLTLLAKSSEPPRFLPQGGVEVYLGNHPDSRGYYTPRREIAASPIGHVFEARIAAEAETKHSLGASATNAHYLGKALGNAVSHPLTTSVLWLRKVRLFFNSFEPPSEDYLPRLQEQFWLLRAPVSFGLLVWLAAFGVLALWKRGQRRLALLYVGVVAAALLPSLLTFVSWRFRLPAIPALAVLAAAGIVFLVEKARTYRLEAASIALGAGILAFYPALPFEERQKLHQKLAVNEALSRRAEERSPSSLSTRSLISMGRHSEAFREIASKVPTRSEDAWMNGHYVRYLCWLGQGKKAVDFLDALKRSDRPAYTAALVHIPPAYRASLGIR